MTNLTEEQIKKMSESIKKDCDKVMETIPPRFSHCKVEDIPKNILKTFDSILDEKGIYMFGDCGTGKTYLAWCLFKLKTIQRMNDLIKFISSDKADSAYHYSLHSNIRVFSWVEILRLLKNSMSKDSQAQYTIEEDFDPQILILDDVGAEKASDWSIETLYYLINDRYEKNKPTIITSNLSLKELAEKVGDRIPSRIAEMCEVIKLEGHDKRLKAVKDNPTFKDPI